MPRFFSDNINDNAVIITGSDAVHIGRSLRMRLGDELLVCNNGIEYNTIIESISDEQVVCKIKSFQTSQTEPNVKLTLFQAMPKSDKLDFIVQKAVELGVSKICTVIKKVLKKRKKDCKKLLLRQQSSLDVE